MGARAYGASEGHGTPWRPWACGLNIFIQDVRNAANKEVEQERVDKELANIRKKFKKVKDMTPYDRKKCVV